MKSAVHKMTDNKFHLMYQQLMTTSIKCVHAFTNKGKQYLAVIDLYDSKGKTFESPVYIWT